MTIVIWLLALTVGVEVPHVQHFFDRNQCLRMAELLVTYGQAEPGTTCQRLEIKLDVTLLPTP